MFQYLGLLGRETLISLSTHLNLDGVKVFVIVCKYLNSVQYVASFCDNLRILEARFYLLSKRGFG